MPEQQMLEFLKGADSLFSGPLSKNGIWKSYAEKRKVCSGCLWGFDFCGRLYCDEKRLLQKIGRRK